MTVGYKLHALSFYSSVSRSRDAASGLRAIGRLGEEREINYCLCLCLKQAMSKAVYRRRTKGAGGPSNSQTSGDWAESILSRALTRSRQCHQCKIGPCHASKWDPGASRGIRPTSVMDDHKVEYEGRQLKKLQKVKPLSLESFTNPSVKNS